MIEAEDDISSIPDKKRTYLMPGLALIIGFIVILTLLFMNNMRESEHQSHLFINTLEEALGNISEFRHWFEVYIAGDRSKGPDELLTLLNITSTQIHIMLVGGMNSHGVNLRSADSPPIVTQIISLEKTLNNLRESSAKRLALLGSARPSEGRGNGSNYGFTGNFNKFIWDARVLESHLIAKERWHTARSHRMSTLFMVIWALAVSIAAIGLTILERKRASAVEALRRSEDDLSTILKSIGEGIVKFDSSFTIHLVNEEFCNIFGYSEDELLGEELSIILSGEKSKANKDGQWHGSGANPAALPGKRVERKGLHKDGRVFPVELRTDKLTATAGEQFYTCVIRNITARKELLNRLRDLSYFDELTSIGNRRSHDKNLITEWNRAKRRRTPISIIMVDIDYFKDYNDNYGHAAGDDCLRRVAQALQSIIVRAGDSIARYGGEEFVVILPGSNLGSAKYLAELMRRKIESLQIEHASSTVSEHVTISLGVASAIPTDDGYPEALLSTADDALYKAKNNGRNCVEEHSKDLQDSKSTVPPPIHSVK